MKVELSQIEKDNIRSTLDSMDLSIVANVKRYGKKGIEIGFDRVEKITSDLAKLLIFSAKKVHDVYSVTYVPSPRRLVLRYKDKLGKENIGCFYFNDKIYFGNLLATRI